MAYTRKYPYRINWEDDPSHNTALCSDNLNQMDYALNAIDQILQTWDSSKADTSYVNEVQLAVTNLLTALNNFKTSTNAELTRLDRVKAEELTDLDDVAIVNAKDEEALVYDSLLQKWKNQKLETAPDIGLFIKNGILMCRYSK